MLPRSKPLLAFLVAVPLLLVVWMWQLAQKRPRLVAVLSSNPLALALSHDGRLLAVKSADGFMGILSTSENRFLPLQTESKTPTRASAGISSPTELQFSPDAQTLFGFNARTRLYNAQTDMMYAWNPQTRKINWSLVSPSNPDYSRFWASPSGKLIAQRFYSTVKVFDTSKGAAPQTSDLSKFAHSFPVIARFQARIGEPDGGYSLPQALALSPDGKTIALSTIARRTEFWDVQTGTRQSQTTAASPTSSDKSELQFSPDGRFVAFFDGITIFLWNIATRKWTSATVSSPTTTPQTSLAWMPDSRFLWTGAGSTQQWSVPQLKPLRELYIGGALAVSGDGHTLATRNIPGTGTPHGVWLWNIA